MARARSAGAYVLGKTNLDEFGMGSGGSDSMHGPTKSVWRSGMKYELRRRDGSPPEGDVPTGGLEGGDWIVSGGSSGGSAVAVSAGACLAALGSDTGGSGENEGEICLRFKALVPSRLAFAYFLVYLSNFSSK